MKFQEIVVFIFLIIIILSVISTIRIIKKNDKLSKREKNNLIFIQIFLPVIGALIYMVYKNKKSAKRG